MLIGNNPQVFGTEKNLAISENPCAVYGKCEFPKCKLFIIFDLIFASDAALIQRNKVFCPGCTEDDLKIKESFEKKMWEKIIFIKSYIVKQIYRSQIFDTIETQG